MRSVQIFRRLEPEDFRVLQAIELGMESHEIVPKFRVEKNSSLPSEETRYRLDRLDYLRLIRHFETPYEGYSLNTSGYDCLALNYLVKSETIEAFGKPLGVGKESDVYDALTPSKTVVAVKFHRLGRTSFRQTRRVRTYPADRSHISWLYQSRLGAEREYKALSVLSQVGVSVPSPIAQNRHVLVMSLIEGRPLIDHLKLPRPRGLLNEILLNLRTSYMKAGIIHGDLSEYNVIVKPDEHVLIIDWPQFAERSSPSAESLLERDLENILTFFSRRFRLKTSLEEALRRVRGSSE
jgi:RIO kinase 2